ncbi:MAG: sensor histidine kinase [Rhodopirellula sp. JB044]|uniref:sensor histidine kinase n=1 Tax=Rhodopirellula sp. JB044 TaxID=3342844 RepID=UPI00370AE5CC
MRIQIWHAAILSLVVFGFAGLTYWQQSSWRMRETDRELAAAVEVLTSQLATIPNDEFAALTSPGAIADADGSRANATWQNLSVPDTFVYRRVRNRFEMPYFVISDSTGKTVKTSTQRFERTPPGAIYPPQRSATYVLLRRMGEWREAYAQGPAGTTILAGRFIGTDYRDLHELAWTLTAVGVLLLFVGLIGGWIVSGRAVAPINQIASVAETISASELSDRINTDSMDREFAGLADTLNRAFDRLESAFQRQSQFTSDASHELRTPLSVISMHQQLALSKPRSEDEYRETLVVCQRATKRMTDLVESLLVLARLDANPSPRWSTVELGKLATNSIEELLPLAKPKQITVETQFEQSVFVRGDKIQLTQVITNLLQNAINHSSVGSPIEIFVNATTTRAKLRLVDHGPGIAAEHLDKIFDRFYRIEADRNRSESGGSGLGLSICRSILELHRGQISVSSQHGTGCQFEISLPRVPAPPGNSAGNLNPVN